MPELYVPVLKAKEGEFAALEALNNKTKDVTIPLLEIPGVPIDHASGMPSKTLDQHISNLPDRLFKAWQTRSFYLDTPNFIEGERTQIGDCALKILLEKLEDKEAGAIPVIRTESSMECFRAVEERPNLTACVRLSLSDFSEDKDTDELLSSLLRRIGRNTLANMDLVIDLGELPRDQSTAVLIARSLLSMVPRNKEWRRVILSAASFPEDLSGVTSRSVDRLPRKEWMLWKTLQKRPSLLPVKLVFSDNTISHPTLKGIDPRVMRMSAAIRYTSEDDWVIVKGSSVGRFGFEQYFDLCKRLVELPDYAGEDFSWGDRFIADCARSMAGPGNATTWRKVGVNHHITLAAYQLSSFPDV